MAKFFFTTLFFLILFISHSSSSSHEIQPQKPSDSNASPSHCQVFYLKNTNNPFSAQEHVKKRKTKRHSTKKQGQRPEKQMLKNNLNSRTFTVMLPKGFAPPSGSSPCHNEHPTSPRFHCHLSATKP
ncbi:hypothetical protein L6164_031844 [Bauhinia variegata]|uniref:Uncharacterized protein n=1 Tax=Bauhinia variegata TaxID=167791 RepID=A0ACB9KLZ3_BAUVA|nr:hypothetical protein L6164_031844 [Bauhinia variegata]